MGDGKVGVRRIGQIAVTVADLARAVSFYRERLGLRFLFEVPKMAFFEVGGVRLMLGVPESEEFAHPASLIYYEVADLEASYELLVEREVVFESEPHKVADLGEKELWMAFFRDSEGNMLALLSEVHKAE